jgi:hypothetical protein
MADPINSAPAAREGDGGHAAEIAARDAEIERLRGLLVTRDQELGEATGRLKIIEDRSERMARVVERIPIPGLAWIVSGAMRVLRPSDS